MSGEAGRCCPSRFYWPASMSEELLRPRLTRQTWAKGYVFDGTDSGVMTAAQLTVTHWNEATIGLFLTACFALQPRCFHHRNKIDQQPLPSSSLTPFLPNRDDIHGRSQSKANSNASGFFASPPILKNARSETARDPRDLMSQQDGAHMGQT